MNTEELIYKRIKNHEGRIKNKNKTNKLVYMPGDRVMLQNIRTKDFNLTGTVESQRVTYDGQIVSYIGEKTNNMRSSQTNLEVFSIGVKQNNKLVEKYPKSIYKTCYESKALQLHRQDDEMAFYKRIT